MNGRARYPRKKVVKEGCEDEENPDLDSADSEELSLHTFGNQTSDVAKLDMIIREKADKFLQTLGEEVADQVTSFITDALADQDLNHREKVVLRKWFQYVIGHGMLKVESQSLKTL